MFLLLRLLKITFIKIINKFYNYFYFIFKFKLIPSFSCDIRGIKNISIKNEFSIEPHCKIFAEGDSEEKIIIGNRCALNFNVMINANCEGNINIGNNVIIGPNTVIRASNHNTDRYDMLIRDQGHKGGKIKIDDDVWIGANVTILPNVTIGKSTIIGAGSVVTKDIPDFSIAVGVPAKVIKDRRKIN